MKFKFNMGQILKQRDNKKFVRNVAKYSSQVKNSVAFCGDNLTALGEIEIYFAGNVTIGNNCNINPQVFLNGRSGITIGDNVTLSHGVKIITTGYDVQHWMATGEKVHFDNKPVTIGNHCWIGTNAIILPGVNITGEYVVVGAGAVVTKDITESKVVVAGNPAKVIKRY